MKKLLFLLILLISSIVQAQDTTPTPFPNSSEFSAQVFVDSVFLRAAPDKEAERVSSVFENDNLFAIGRNVDGTWFEVRRSGRNTSAGWISKDVVLYTFDVARLPITNLTTGVTGPEPVYDTGISIFVVIEVSLRALPDEDSERLAILPIELTVPALDRLPDSTWIRVNYRGTVGWVASFLIRGSKPLDDIPVNPEYDVNAPLLAFEIIPPEVQLAQVQRMRDFVTPLRDLAEVTGNWWALISAGETVECYPPPGGYAHYPYTRRDLYELPEIRRQVGLLTTAVNDLNSSVETQQRCGVYKAEEISTAYAQAINAHIMFNVVLDRLIDIEEVILTQR